MINLVENKVYVCEICAPKKFKKRRGAHMRLYFMNGEKHLLKAKYEKVGGKDSWVFYPYINIDQEIWKTKGFGKIALDVVKILKEADMDVVKDAIKIVNTSIKKK